jgi:PleD family two-component response regulator
MRALIRRHLEPTDYEMLEAADGEEAVAVARRELPDAMLLDLGLPRLNGFGVLDAVRADHRLAVMPIILVTSRDDPNDVAEGLRRGGHDYLHKPFAPEDLIARVQAAMHTRSLLEELHARSQRLAAGLDADTGLATRGRVEEQLAALVSRSRRHGHPLAVVVVRIEGGRDEVVAASVPIRARVRAEDLAGRLDAQEIAVLAPDTGAPGAQALARALADVAAPACAGWAVAGRDDDGPALLARAVSAAAGAAGGGRGTVRGA